MGILKIIKRVGVIITSSFVISVFFVITRTVSVKPWQTILFGAIFSWILIGFIFSTIKMMYWHRILIKKRVAEKYVDFQSTPMKFLIPIFLLYPLQALAWISSRFSEYDPSLHECAQRQATMPISPITEISITQNSNSNYALMNGEEEYSYPFDGATGAFIGTIGEGEIREEFTNSVLLGGLHILSLIIGLVGGFAYLLVHLFSVIFHGAGKLYKMP